MRAYASKSEHEYIVFEYHKINCLMEVFKREFDDGSVKEGTLYSHDLFYALIGYNVCLVSYLVWLMCDDDSFSMESDYTPIVDKYFIPIQKRYMKTIKIRPIEQN